MLNNKILYENFDIDKNKLLNDWNGFISKQNEKMFNLEYGNVIIMATKKLKICQICAVDFTLKHF